MSTTTYFVKNALRRVRLREQSFLAMGTVLRMDIQLHRARYSWAGLDHDGEESCTLYCISLKMATAAAIHFIVRQHTTHPFASSKASPAEAVVSTSSSSAARVYNSNNAATAAAAAAEFSSRLSCCSLHGHLLQHSMQAHLALDNTPLFANVGRAVLPHRFKKVNGLGRNVNDMRPDDDTKDHNLSEDSHFVTTVLLPD